jgi:hypothetical protein
VKNSSAELAELGWMIGVARLVDLTLKNMPQEDEDMNLPKTGQTSSEMQTLEMDVGLPTRWIFRYYLLCLCEKVKLLTGITAVSRMKRC